MHSDDLTPRTFPSGSMSNTLSQLFSLYFCDWYSLLCYTLLYFAVCATLFLYVLIPLWVLFTFQKNLMAILCNFSGWQPWFPANIRSVFCQLVRQPQRVLCLQRSTWNAEPRKSTLLFFYWIILLLIIKWKKVYFCTLKEVLLSLRGRAWHTEVEFYWSSLRNWQTSRSTRVTTSHLMTCWWLRWGAVMNVIFHADNRHLPSVFFLFSSEISQKKEVLPLCGVLLRHAPTGRRRCHPVWGQHR